MRLVVQRVKQAEVGTAKIGLGFLVLLGVGKDDSVAGAEVLADKLAKLRVMADKSGKMNLSVGEVGGEVLVVSQFTLHADTVGGNRPSFIKAAQPNLARKVYDHFVSTLKNKGLKVKTGNFGEYMEISAILDGPVTILYLD
jgi:D-tyrosyl-tRNA(Tyr) deacylase